jgi:hypothetical protein
MLQKIQENLKTILIIAGVLIFMLFLNQCNQTRKLKAELKNKEQISKQNLEALTDSIKVYKNRLGQTSFSKPIAEMSVKDLEKYYPELYKSLKAELGEVKIIWKTKFEYIDTGSVKNAIVKLDSNKFSLDYDYYSQDSTLHIKSANIFYADAKLTNKETNYYSVFAKPGISTIKEMSLKLGFTTGIKKEGELYKIFITPDSKNVTVGKIEGADVTSMLMPPKPSSKSKKWSIGPYIGFGIGFGKTTYQIGPSVGLSVQYSLIKF